MVEQNLDMVKSFLLEVVRHPGRAAHIPEGSTVVLYPVGQREKKVA